VPEDTTPSDDLLLIQKCLEGDADAILHLQREYGPALVGYLTAKGAAFDEATDLITTLWADGLVRRPEKAPRFQSFAGDCALRTWLNTVALHRFVAKRRTEERWGKIMVDLPKGMERDGSIGRQEAPTSPGGIADFEFPDMPLFELLRDALDAAFGALSAEDYVLAILSSHDGLRLQELAKMWGCNLGAINRDLERIRDEIRSAALFHAKARDPWLELTWVDFLESCRWARPASFGP
jgi:RNA polymerase sigma factor (sigma-70 family)